MFNSSYGRGRSHGRELTNYRGAWLAEREGKNQPGFVFEARRSSSFSRLGWLRRVPGRARKAVTRDVHPRRFARHKQIRIAPSFTMQPENTAAISHFAKTFLHANINLLNIDQLVISIESRRHDSYLFFYFIEKYYSFFSFFSLLWNVLSTNFPTVYNIKKVMI